MQGTRLVLNQINDLLNKIVNRKLLGTVPLARPTNLPKTTYLKYTLEFQMLELEIRIILLKTCLDIIYFRIIYHCKKMLWTLHKRL